MTVTALATGAPTIRFKTWSDIPWRSVEKQIHRLQMRIAKAFREKKYGKAKSLQWLLTHSYTAKLWAVKRVTQNRGAKTPGVDRITWKTPKQKMQAVASLRRRDYKTLPLRRIYIEKKQKGKWRALSIPVMRCRAMQALYLLALEPIAETMADKNSYGFRPRRSAADAIDQCFLALSRKHSADYILEADIQSCFDEISHTWLLKNVPMDKEILAKWLQAGYMEKGEVYPTQSGTPQGGIISPTLLVITLAGLEEAISKVTSHHWRTNDKVHACIYADDFIITGATKEVLEEKVKPAVMNFLRERGLSLSKEKTKITSINEGFDFLGMNIRQYKETLIIKPSKDSVKKFMSEIRAVIKSNCTAKTENLIHLLNPKIRGWSNYFHHVCAKETFYYISHCIFGSLWQWAKRRHPNKRIPWIKNKYFRTKGNRNWVFSSKIKRTDGSMGTLELVDAGAVKIRRHIKVKADATPYDPDFSEYFLQRTHRKTLAAIKRKRTIRKAG